MAVDIFIITVMNITYFYNNSTFFDNNLTKIDNKAM
ncbi:hypothetical protein GGD38_006429 [Chitinophagaceae bacterium OAS944]|nr:hypothetical protein [Chitinophagaceae bacterium OAS944]